MPQIEMFFDLTCPYCYRGHKDLMEVLPGFDAAQILWRPVEAHPKTEEPEHKPYADLAVQGALFVRNAGGDELAYNERVYRAVFDEGLTPDDPAVLAQCAKDVGVDEVAFTAALKRGTYEQALREANDYAYEQNKVWAVPTFVCGKIRLDAVEGVGVTKDQLKAFLTRCCQ